MHQFIGQFFRHGRHQIAMFTKEVDVFVIGRRLEGIDLNGVRRPVLKEQPEGFFREFSCD
jgi:hypothetical protein